MNDSEDIAEFSEALGTAWQVYERGWTTQGQSPNPQLAKLGEGIQKLVEHISNVVRIVGNARICYQQQAIRSPYFRGFFVQKTWDLRSLLEICGNFKATIRDCEALLGQNRDVYRSASSAYGEEWLLVMKPKVDEMCARLQTHNTKLELVLKPLETKLLGDIQQEFAASQQHPQPSMQSMASPLLQGLVVLNLDQTLASYRQQSPNRLEITPEIETQIRTQLQESKPELSYPGNLKLQSTIDVFVEHYDQSTKRFVPGSFIEERQPSAQQYVNLIKAHLTLEYMQQSQELRQAHPNSLWPLFLAELVSIVGQEWQRFSSRGENRIIAPDLNSMKRALRGQREGIGSKEDISKLMSPHYETYSKPIFTIPLPSPQEGIQRRLAISRIDDTKLRLIEAVHEDKGSSAPFGEIAMDIDLTSVQLAPIYAIPSSRPRPLEVLLHTHLGQLHPSFCDVKHIFRLQHLLTGYKVYDRYDQAMVKVNFFIAGQKTPLEEHGRVQLWLPQPFETASKDAEPSKSPVGVSSSTLEDSSASVRPSTNIQTVDRPRSLRKLIPSFRKSSETTLRGKAHNSGTRSRAESNSSIGRDASSSSRTEVSNNAAASGPFELPAATGPTNYLPNAPSYTPQHGINRSHSGNMSQSSAISHQDNRHGYHVPIINQPYDLDDLPEIAQNMTLNPTPQQLERTDPHHDRTSPASEPQGWPYSPDSFAPAAPWREQYHAPNLLASHQRSGSLDMSSIYSDAPRAPSTIKPPGLKVQASPSMVSTRSTKSYSSMASSVTTIRTSTGNSSVSSTGVARMHHKPRKPLLVIFLKSRDESAKLSIVAIQIDSNTSVARERCDCYSSHSTCRRSCVERKSGDLLAQRWEADAGLASFNVAKLGEHQRKESQNVWPNLKRVSLRFDKMEDRYKFAGSPCSCNVQTTHELSRCNLQSHNGVFGIVKQIGDQLLLNYHNERNSALTRPMVLAPLAESD